MTTLKFMLINPATVRYANAQKAVEGLPIRIIFVEGIDGIKIVDSYIKVKKIKK